MKSYLLDTHIFIWAYMKPEKIGKAVARILENPNAVKYLSAISLIEIAQLYETEPKDFDLNIPLSTFLSQALTPAVRSVRRCTYVFQRKTAYRP